MLGKDVLFLFAGALKELSGLKSAISQKDTQIDVLERRLKAVEADAKTYQKVCCCQPDLS